MNRQGLAGWARAAQSALVPVALGLMGGCSRQSSSSQPPPSPVWRTRNELHHFAQWCTWFTAVRKSIPGRSVDECLRTLQADPDFAGRVRYFSPSVCRNRDFWGRSFRSKFEERAGVPTLTVYSVGPNGRDEGGAGDDIARAIVFEDVPPAVPTTGPALPCGVPRMP